jgi:hypothetical protein
MAQPVASDYQPKTRVDEEPAGPLSGGLGDATSASVASTAIGGLGTVP